MYAQTKKWLHRNKRVIMVITPNNFQELPWHDAIIENIIVDRTEPEEAGMIRIDMNWPEEYNVRSRITFSELYYASFNLNFGIIGYENVLSAEMLVSVKNWIKFVQGGQR